ncbi:hypothetical protein KR009_005945 [Drosophila setifemur]|nr:hypothetical protein KR009_005945 [Drosophila setifemur]
MDESVNPCSDFYRHACGKWPKVHANDSYRSVLDNLDHNYESRLADLLEEQGSGEDPRLVGLLRDYYTSCRQNLTHSQAMDILEKIAQSSEIDSEAYIVGLTAAFRMRIQLLPTMKSSELWSMLITRDSGESPDRNESSNVPMTRQEFDSTWQMFPWLGEKANQEEFWLQVSHLERQLLVKMGSYRWFQEEQKMPLHWMLPWPQTPPTLFDSIHMVIIITGQPRDFLLRYILLRLAHNKVNPATSWQIDREECAEQTRRFLSHPAAWLMELHHPRLQEEAKMRGIFLKLKQRFADKLLANRNEFNTHTMHFLMAKLSRMILRLSIMPRRGGATEEQIEEHYRDVRFQATDYFGNLLAALHHQAAVLQSPLKYSYQSRKSWLPVYGFGVYASPYFISVSNMLVVPLSFLEQPLFGANQSDLLTYSSLGFVLGHELSHGFSPNGLEFSARGEHNPGVYNKMKTNPRFQRQLDCLDTRFRPRMEDEKFADATGLELAYSAYFGGDLPRVEDQSLFFLNFAQFFCSSETKNEKSKIHGSDRSRVNDAVRHFRPFQELFACQKRKRRSPCELY